MIIPSIDLFGKRLFVVKVKLFESIEILVEVSNFSIHVKKYIGEIVPGNFCSYFDNHWGRGRGK